MFPTTLFEDEALLVIHKPAGWIAHVGAGDRGQEIVSDWFVKNYPQVMEHSWDNLERVGIVHRLDKDTSGIMVLAKTPEILLALQAQFKAREVKKVYQAFVYGIPREREGHIETFIGRHPKHRQEQAVLPIQVGEAARREAITDYTVDKTFTYKKEPLAKIIFHPQTGRMHQLRVHAKYLGTPILGDEVYTIKPAKRLSKLLGLTRQMLHASDITLTHPSTGKTIFFHAPFPKDMVALEKQIS